jgi:hypothetical protein
VPRNGKKSIETARGITSAVSFALDGDTPVNWKA